LSPSLVRKTETGADSQAQHCERVTEGWKIESPRQVLQELAHSIGFSFGWVFLTALVGASPAAAQGKHGVLTGTLVDKRPTQNH
jgi:hypothetical protein